MSAMPARLYGGASLLHAPRALVRLRLAIWALVAVFLVVLAFSAALLASSMRQSALAGAQTQVVRFASVADSVLNSSFESIDMLLASTMIMRLRAAPALNTLLATMMLGTVLRESIRLFFPNGSNPQPFPHLLPDWSLHYGQLSLRFDNLVLFSAGAAGPKCA